MRWVSRRSVLGILFALATVAGSFGLALGLAGADNDALSAVHSPPLFSEPAPEGFVVHPPALQEAVYEGGRSACRRCHLRQFRSWQRTPHADAFEVLPVESRTDPECVRCHVTGYGQPGGFTSIEATPELAGVTCEVCHGPGSLYKDEEIMKDREASLAAGLLIPNEQTCLACHNAESPDFPGSFDYEAAKAAGVHEIGG